MGEIAFRTEYPELAAIADLVSAADKLPYFTGAGAATLADFKADIRTLAAAASMSALRTAAGLAIGTDVQAYDADLAAIAALVTTSYGRAFLVLANQAALFALIGLDTDTALAANSDIKVASQKATKAYVDQIVASQDAMVFKGVIDCSANPNYPAADRGWTYRASVAGKIGGASGIVVQIGDIILCLDDSTAGGDQATVGTHWTVIQTNIDGALTTTDIGVNVQAYDAELAAIAGLVSAADRLPYFTGLGAAALATFTAAGRSLVAGADAAAQRTTLGLGSIATYAEASAAEYRAATASRALSAANVWSAADWVALTDAATVAVDLSTGINFTVTLAGNRTLGNPTNTKNGQSGVIEITQDGTGTRTLAYASNWKFVGGIAPVLTTTAGAIDCLYYTVKSSTRIVASLSPDVK